MGQFLRKTETLESVMAKEDTKVHNLGILYTCTYTVIVIHSPCILKIRKLHCNLCMWTESNGREYSYMYIYVHVHASTVTHVLHLKRRTCTCNCALFGSCGIHGTSRSRARFAEVTRAIISSRVFLVVKSRVVDLYVKSRLDDL